MKEECSSSHRYQPRYEPKCNCRSCWFKYFTGNPNKFLAAKMGLELYGKETMVKVRGDKYVKFLTEYIKRGGVA